MGPTWTEREEALLEKAWSSTSYSREDLCRIFSRSWGSLEKKASRMNLQTRFIIEEKSRVDAIEMALRKEYEI